MPLNPFRPTAMHTWAVEHPVGYALVTAVGGALCAFWLLVLGAWPAALACWVLVGLFWPVYGFFLFRPGGRGPRRYEERTHSR